MATASSYLDRPVRDDVVIVGEVGLTGEIRAVTNLEGRLREAAQLGFRRAVVPARNLSDGARAPLEVVEVSTLADALRVLLP